MTNMIDEAALIVAVTERDFYKREWERLILYCATLERRNEMLDNALASSSMRHSTDTRAKVQLVVSAGGSNDNG